MENTEKARNIVFEYVKQKCDARGAHPTFALDEVHIVWFAYILGGWKALVITTLPDQMYYEVTHNIQADGETYLDAYGKIENILVPKKEESNG